LHHSAQKIADHFGYKGLPVVISNACISGLAAMLVGKRLIESGQYQNAVVAGADMITKFILSGFQSFQAVADEPCRPFDESRKGITLGEAAATVILTAQKGTGLIRFSGGAVSNDANHISGPSRSGEELSMAINKTLRQAGINNNDIGFISAHGTATIYNDEMEAKAISLAGLESKPVNSLKGYYGHTLGAAGLLEAIVSIESLKNNLVLPTLGFTKSGVSKPIFINDKLIKAESQHCLKTASGFGGCNAALVFSKQQ
ncbi:MAG: beta-ketoacyl synthase, partial [Gemmatimonadaceae bacterium]|nr:beta-ketoacyl synthase [Chitinophagaceae bacterium]